jgi:aryl-alcohol dehydrogenase-like predicted oxidoreductase
MRASTFPSFEFPSLAIGAMPLSFDEVGDDPIEVLTHAFDLGLTLVDTADIYSPSAETIGHNEIIVGNAVRAWSGERSDLFVLTKNGLRRSGDDWWRDNSPEWMLRAAEHSNEALGFVPDCIAVHRINRDQSLAECIRGMMAVRDRGLTRSIGLSNVTQAEFDLAWEVSEGSIVVVENEYSPRLRTELSVIETCGERGVVYLPWSPLGGGDDARRLGELYPVFADVAQHHGVSPQAVALAWLRHLGPTVVPVPGFRRLETLNDAVTSRSVHLSADEIATLSASPAGPGSVYPD